MCRRCGARVEGEPLTYQGETFHPYHFSCAGCGVELTSSAREVRNRPGLTANKVNELYCLRCHDKMNIPICGACRRPIEGRVVTALGKHWHVEHFACAKCEKPFLGHSHYERKGLAYCAHHYQQLFGVLCYHCDGVIQGDIFTALDKAWCSHHFNCTACDKPLGQKTKGGVHIINRLVYLSIILLEVFISNGQGPGGVYCITNILHGPPLSSLKLI